MQIHYIERVGGKQKVKKPTNDNIFYIALFLLVAITFVLFNPKVASMLFPFKRQMVLTDFLRKVQTQQTIPPQDFWEFREFYSPGSYVFDRNGLSGTQVVSAEKTTGTVFLDLAIDRVFLTFSSPHTTSIEALVLTPDLSKVIDISSLDKKTVLFARPNELIYKDAQDRVHIVFVQSEADMQGANGFFDYAGADKRLVTGKYWFDSTVVDGK